MSFLTNIFKKKPGGTTIGNILRGVANKATGGVLGNGANMISQEDADKRDLTDTEFYAKYGMTKNGVVLPNQAATPQPTPQDKPDPLATTKWAIFKAWFKTNWWLIALPFGIVIMITAFVLRRKKPKKRW